MTNRLDALIEEGLAHKVYSAARACVYYRGHPVYSGGNVPGDARFDLASVTKVMSTTALCARLGIDPRMPVGDVFFDAGAADRTVADLLYHRSGLPAFEPFFAYCKTRVEAVQAALSTAPKAPAGTAAVYSDIGFIILGELISALYGGAPLDQLFAEHVAAPLQLATAGFRRVSAPPSDTPISTGGTRPREPAPGQEGMWHVTPRPSRVGDVDDDNAYVMDGVAGHAGLFATADELAAYGQAVLGGWLGVAFDIDHATPGSTRTYGFDTPSATAASCGPRFGPRAIGHTGFTGTTLWIDLDRDIVVALLTNRVIYGRANLQIRQFRPRFHEAVLDELLTQGR